MWYSCGLKPHGYAVWGYVEQVVYIGIKRYETMDELKKAVKSALDGILLRFIFFIWKLPPPRSKALQGQDYNSYTHTRAHKPIISTLITSKHDIKSLLSRLTAVQYC